MKTKNKTKTLINVILLVALVALIFVLSVVMSPGSMIFVVLQKSAVYAVVAVSMNLLNGFTGLFSLGQAGFMLLGAYTYAIFTIPVAVRNSVYMYFDGGIIQFTLPVPVALILAGIVAALFALLIGLPVLRLKSDYLAIATLGFAEILRALCQWDSLGVLTNGSNMLREFPSFDSLVRGLGENVPFVADHLTFFVTMFPIVLAGICIAIIVLLINSSYGRAFKAIRDDEIAAEAMGINLPRHKMMSFCVSAFFAGIGGAMLAMFQSTIQANAFKSAMTYEILLIVVIGGIGSLSGSVLASFLFVACSEWWLRFLDNEALFTAGSKTAFVVVAILVVLAVAAFVLFRYRKTDKRQKITAYIVAGIAAVGVVAWLIWYLAAGGLQVPLLRSGFRLVVFSIVIMAMVLFYRRGIMGDREFDPTRLFSRISRKKDKEVDGNG